MRGSSRMLVLHTVSSCMCVVVAYLRLTAPVPIMHSHHQRVIVDDVHDLPAERLRRGDFGETAQAWQRVLWESESCAIQRIAFSVSCSTQTTGHNNVEHLP